MNKITDIFNHSSWMRFCSCVMLSLLVTSCATVPTDPFERADYERLNDPLEPFNRVMFSSNQTLDEYVMEPLSTAYGYIPSFVRTRIDNLLDLQETPFEFINYVLQGESEKAGNALARILLNAVLGLGGLFDVATAVGVPRQDTDLAITLGKWGMGEGPYLVMPIFGPTTLRGILGKGIQAIPYVTPLGILYQAQGVALEVSLSSNVARGVNARYNFGDAIDSLKRDSLDYYASTRSFYRQYRRSLVGFDMAEEIMLPVGASYGGEDYDVLAPSSFLPSQEDYDILGPSPVEDDDSQ